MASRYWVGGTAAWDGTAGTKWALTSGGAGGQAVPTSADDVFFDAASGAVTCTIASGNTGAKSVNCTGFTGTLNCSATIAISGSFTLVAGMTYTGTGSLQFNGSGTITSAGKTLGGITIIGAGITVNLGDALSSSGAITVTQGTFTTNNYNVTATSLSSSNSNTRTINLGSSTVTISGPTSVNFSTQTGLTFNAGTSTIIAYDSSAALSIGTGVTFNNVSFTGSGSNISLSITGTNTFNQLSFTAPASAGVTKCSFSASQTITTMVCSGTSAVNRIFLRADAGVSSVTLNATTWTTVSDVDFQRITLTNAKSPTRGGDCGGNTNITFPAAKTVYWNLAGAQIGRAHV